MSWEGMMKGGKVEIELDAFISIDSAKMEQGSSQ
jgi:hypothetical protein